MSRLATLGVLCLIAASTACDKVPLLAPTQSTITLTVNTTSVPANGTATVIASVTEQAGTPAQNGTVVTFTSSFGTIEPAEARTEGGKATVLFHAGTRSGTASIAAFSGATRAEAVELLVGGAAAERITVRVEPGAVPQTGGTVQVIAVVTDVAGNPLPGAPVVFSADNGTLAANSGVTDDNGRVETSLTTNRETVVTATVAAHEATATVRSVSLPTVTITSATTAPSVGAPVVFTITPATATTGNPIRQVTIDWGDGSTDNLGAISGATSISHIFSSGGSFTVTATATDVTGLVGTTSTVVVLQRNVPVVTLTATPNPVAAGSSVSFGVSAQPALGAPPIQSVQVSINGETVFTGVAGTGTFTRVFNTAGSYTAVATATDLGGTTATASIVVEVTAPGIAEMTLDETSGRATCSPTGDTFPKDCVAAGPPLVLQFAAAFTGTPPTGITGYTWSFGDGSSETTTNPNTNHSYTTANQYTVTVTANTNSGSVGSAKLTLTVN